MWKVFPLVKVLLSVGNKVELRTQLKQKLKEEQKVSNEKDVELSKRLIELLLSIKSQKNCERLLVGVFSPILDEPKWFHSFERLEGKVDFAIVHMGENLELTYHPCELKQVSSLDFGLELPSELLVKTVTPEVILVPGLGYTKACERLGRGKGYFDRFLADFSGMSVGIFYGVQEVDHVYADKYDQPLDYIVTENKVIIRGR